MTNLDTTAGMTDKQAQSMLQQAAAHLQNNQLELAETLLEQVLAQRPDEPNALQLKGVIRRLQRRDGEAEPLYRRSLAVKPDQPQVHHNLGNLLKASGRLDEAIASQREAVRLKPNYIEAHLNLGLALSAKGEHAAAEKSFRAALHIQPGYMFAKQSLAATLNDLSRPKEAEAILRQALAAGSPDPRQIAAFEHNLGVSLSLQQRHDEALALFESAQAKVPEMPHVDYNRGNALQHLGQLEAAVGFYRRAIARDPLNMLAHRDLNHLFYRMEEDQHFLRSYDDVMALYPEVGDIPLSKASFQFLKKDFENARENFERAAVLLPDDIMPLDGLAMTMARLGDFDAAIHAHETAVKLEPDNAHAWRNYSETLLRAGDAPKGLSAADQALAIEPEHQGALAYKGTALRMLDDPRGEELNDYENLIQVFEIAPPQGYSDLETFNQDLNAYLDRLHVDKREILMQTLRGGTQTFDNVFGRGHELIERLRLRIDEAVAAYIARMKSDPNHPLMKRRRNSFGYSASWSSRLRDGGYHTNHIHPKGWISSAYYVALPDTDAASKDGWIKFGEPDFDAGFKNPISRVVQPRIGRLVLFPSYMWHGTNPFHSKKARTTIAFDVVPE